MSCGIKVKARLVSAIVLSLSLGAWAHGQGGDPGQNPGGSGNGQGNGRHGGRGGGAWGGMMGGAGHGVVGTVTEVAADHYTVKTENGEIYTVHYSVNSRILKQSAPRHTEGGRGRDAGEPPQPIKSTDIKVGDAIAASGEVDTAAKSVGAIFVVQIDPERAKQLREMQANYGKTWLMGKVTAIDGVKVTLQGSIDNKSHSFVADESTTFRKHREPITLADVQMGDMVRIEGSFKEGAFLATSVTIMTMPTKGAFQ